MCTVFVQMVHSIGRCIHSICTWYPFLERRSPQLRVIRSKVLSVEGGAVLSKALRNLTIQCANQRLSLFCASHHLRRIRRGARLVVEPRLLAIVNASTASARLRASGSHHGWIVRITSDDVRQQHEQRVGARRFAAARGTQYCSSRARAILVSRLRRSSSSTRANAGDSRGFTLRHRSPS